MKIQPEEKTSSPPPPMASVKGDVRQLTTNGSATVAELRAFLKQLKGRSPQEMLGIVAGSQLMRAICISTVVVAIAGVVFTAIPYALGAAKDKAAEVTKGEQPAAPTAPKPAIPLPESPATPNSGAKPDQPTPGAPDLSKLGVGEEKKAPPNENPLENKKDEFLKGLE